MAVPRRVIEVELHDRVRVAHEFLVFPWLLPRLGFWLTLVASAVLTIACFLALAFVLRRFGAFPLP